MICDRCKKTLGIEEGERIYYLGQELTVCCLCLNDIREYNIKRFEDPKQYLRKMLSEEKKSG